MRRPAGGEEQVDGPVGRETRFAAHAQLSPRARRDQVTVTHTEGAGSARFAVPFGTAISPGDTVLVGERWF